VGVEDDFGMSVVCFCPRTFRPAKYRWSTVPEGKPRKPRTTYFLEKPEQRKNHFQRATEKNKPGFSGETMKLQI
jgi:hypothetical protein